MTISATSREQEYLAALEECVAERLRQPDKWKGFVQEGELRQDHIRAYVKQFIHFVNSFPRWLAIMAANTPYYEVRRFLVENLYEEIVSDENAGVPHYEFMFRLGEGVGVSREEIEGSTPSPTVLACLHALENFTRQRPWLEAFAGTAVSEGTNNPDMLRRYGRPNAIRMTDRLRALGLNDYHLTHYIAHSTADVEHGNIGMSLSAKYAVLEDYSVDRLVKGVRERNVLMRRFHDAVYEAVMAETGEG
jgi:pyrroloquinoline quinone (PQQ) biosynthesis protein C